MHAFQSILSVIKYCRGQILCEAEFSFSYWSEELIIEGEAIHKYQQMDVLPKKKNHAVQ